MITIMGTIMAPMRTASRTFSQSQRACSHEAIKYSDRANATTAAASLPASIPATPRRATTTRNRQLEAVSRNQKKESKAKAWGRRSVW